MDFFFFFLPVSYASVELMMEHGVPSPLFWLPLSFRGKTFHFYEYFVGERAIFSMMVNQSHFLIDFPQTNNFLSLKINGCFR